MLATLPDPSAYIMAGDCVVKAMVPPETIKPRVEAVIVDSLLDCIWREESSRGKNMLGDYRKGVPMAYGHFQIWLSVHPDVTYDCAMDFDCSAAWTQKMLAEGHEEWWTSYNKCR